MEGTFFIRKNDRKQIRKARRSPASSPERGPATKQEQPSTAAIDKLLDQLLLGGSEIVCFHRPDHQRLVAKKILDMRWEAVGEFLRIVNSLPVNFVFAGA